MTAPVRILLVDGNAQFTLIELSRICQVDVADLIALVQEGALTPCDGGTEPWRFADSVVPRAR